MKTIGSRLTLIYVLAVAGTMGAIFSLGLVLLERQVRASLDAALAARFADLSDRLLVDPETPAHDAASLVASQAGASFFVTVTDRWNDPAYRAARNRGEVPPDASSRSFFNGRRAEGDVRVMEGNFQSLHIRIETPLVPLREATHAYVRASLAIIALALAFSVIAGRWLSRVALRPVRIIRETAARIGSDNLSERIPIAGVEDELSSLAHLLNQTFDRMEASFQQISRFSEDASHELKTPLSLVRLNVERLVGRETLSPSGRESLQDAIEEIHRLDTLIERLLFLSRAQAGEVAIAGVSQDPRPFIDSFSHDARVLSEEKGIAYVEERNDPGTVRFDPGHLRQVLFNLLSNALHATPSGGRVVLRSSFSDRAWRVELEDDGPGLPADKCSVIFERFIRLRLPGQPMPGKGAGLGLAICRSIVELHHGRIRAEPRPGGHGLRVSFELPSTGRTPAGRPLAERP